MDNQLPELKVNMLGRFSITYGEQPITFKRNSATKAVKLLQILLHSSLVEDRGSTGIPRAQLLDDLFGREELANVGNNLRVTVFRLRKMLIEAGLPEYEYIVKEKGVFYWRSPMKVDLDVARFMELVREGEEEVDETRKMNLWEKACRLYKGELLPMQSGEDWVIMNSVRYKDKYSKILRRLCAYRKEQHEYDTILELTDNAIEIYPFDEWQSLKIDALMGMNRYKEAYQLYDATSKMFFEELGITPSERMMNQFQEMSERMGRKYHAAGEIKEDLKEPEYEDGAFYCSLPSFRDNYRAGASADRAKRTVRIPYGMLPDRRQRPSDGKPGKAGCDVHGTAPGSKKQSAPRRFLFQIQPVSVPDPSGRHQPGKL